MTSPTRPRSRRFGLRLALAGLLAGLCSPLLVSQTAEAAAGTAPAAVRSLPSTTSQAIRVVRTNRWCSRVYCTRVEAWQRQVTGRWQRVVINGTYDVRSQIGPRGFAPPGGKRQGDGRTPTGVYSIKTTFSTDTSNPGVAMTWRQRKPTTAVWGNSGYYYNTWINRASITNGDRPSMRYGFWIDYNNARLRPGVGPAPRPGYGSGIFLHVVPPTDPTGPSEGCVMARLAPVKWLVFWLDRDANPRVVLNL